MRRKGDDDDEPREREREGGTEAEEEGGKSAREHRRRIAFEQVSPGCQMVGRVGGEGRYLRAEVRSEYSLS